MIIVSIIILLLGTWMFTQSQSGATLPACVMTIGAAVLIVGILS